MPLLSCKLCGKAFNSAGGRTCSACLARIEAMYPDVRDFLRDNPKIEFNVETLAEELDVEIRDIQALVDMGYLDRDLKGDYRSEDSSRQKLAKEFEDSLKRMQQSTNQRQDSKNASYGQERYSDKDKNKR